MDYREIKSDNLYESLNLVWRVFSEFVAPDFSEEGIETFRNFIKLEEIKKLLDDGNFFMMGCYHHERIVGVLALKNYCHISLFFVDKEYHKRGIAKQLFIKALKHCLNKNPQTKEITVYSSPYAVEIYKKLDFKVTGDKTILNGITFIPMKMIIHSNLSDEIIRHATKEDLMNLLDLYKHLNKDDPDISKMKSLVPLWESIINDPHQNYLVLEVEGKMVSTCVLVVINNLTRGAKPYGLIENVVTHENFRGKGYGTKLLKKTIEIARDKGCYKVMLLSGRGKETQKFYEKAGFEKGKKTGFIIRYD
ncbi:UNVERIFIED_CONTAM: N-acetylglutamate synthase-like GNAT family acetyltransferase [Acetivibrio alkalicellulosi]